MNFLTWMFGLGALAIAFPLLFHLIRRTPRGKQTFSSLIFLRESPPRITSKSRLQNWLLLLLRSLAVVLLAIAFMRPFFPSSTQVTKPIGKRIAILIDTSASMRRGSLWEKAVNKAMSLLDEIDPDDDIALFAFDHDVDSAIEFNRSTSDTSIDKKTLIRQELARLAPNWSKTDLGKALVFAAERIDAMEGSSDGEEDDRQVGGQIFVISDLQAGASLTALSHYTWPKNVLVEVHAVKPAKTGNVFPAVMVDQANQVDPLAPRVRLTNSADSQQTEFLVNWSSNDQANVSDPAGSVKFLVAAGSSQVLPVPRSDPQLTELSISGDSSFFDNRCFVAPLKQQEIVVGYLGDDGGDDGGGDEDGGGDDGPADTPQRKIVVLDQLSELEKIVGSAATSPDLLVIARTLDENSLALVKDHLRLGKAIFVVLQSQKMAESLQAVLGTLEVEEIVGDKDGDYRMLGRIDFKHPLFKPLSGRKYNDFTKIRFWRHRAVLNLDDRSVEVIARFDNGDPAIWSQAIDESLVLVMTTGWNPAESQLGLSTKFVPLMLEILNQAIGEQTLRRSWHVDDTIELPSAKTELDRKIVTPSGSEIKLAAEQATFSDTDEPGIYKLNQDSREFVFAVNLDDQESRTMPIDPEQLSVYQVRLGNQPTRQELIDRLQQANNVQIESRQKIWKWAIVVILIVLIFETVLAGRRQEVQQLPMETAG